MIFEETKDYLKSYKNMKNRVEYLENVLVGVKSISYKDSPTGSYSEPKTKNDFILMKDNYVNEMSEIRDNVEKLTNITHRDVLFFKYICCMDFCEVAEIMKYSESSVKRLIKDAIEELSNIL